MISSLQIKVQMVRDGKSNVVDIREKPISSDQVLQPGNHPGGVNVAFADGRVQLLSEDIDGAVYAALFSPASIGLDSTPLRQVIPSSNQF